MKVGVPRESGTHECRVAIATAGVRERCRHGHEVLMEREAGVGSSIPGHDFERAGASGGSDQGGCFEDSHPTTHAEPTLRVHESVSYCVATMPGAVPNTSTHAVTDATLRSVLALASNGRRQASRDDESLAEGRNTYAGSVVCAPVAEAHGLTVLPPADALA